MMKHISRVVLLGGLACILATAPLAVGQVASRMTGTVQDQTGAVIPGVSVTLTEVNKNVSQTTTSNSLWQNTLFSGGEKQRGGQRRA
ncbi:MAG: carboxypeptidase-like regulatory domain-containing protein, partial [Acidobacteria bacterium]|nr:carboxypeptidase-like regulatory domain-containing protein [Acidobacteriota bacterium]